MPVGRVGKLCHSYRISARRVHTKDRPGRTVRKQNGVIWGPRAAPGIHNIAYRLRRAASHTDLHQFTALKISDVITIGRPKGIRRALGPRDLARFQRVQRVDPEWSREAASASDAGDVGDITSVGGQTEHRKSGVR